MTEQERRLAYLAVRKQELTDELTEVRQEMRDLAQQVSLPVVTTSDGCAVMISKPQTRGSVPQVKVVRYAGPDLPEEAP